LKQFLASVNLFVDKSQKENVLKELSKLRNTQEVYDVAGEYDVVSLVSAASIEEFRDVLQNKIVKIKGVKSVITTVVLTPHKIMANQKENEPQL